MHKTLTIILLSLLSSNTLAGDKVQRVAKFEYSEIITYASLESERIEIIPAQGSVVTKNNSVILLNNETLRIKHQIATNRYLKSDLDLKRSFLLIQKDQISKTEHENHIINNKILQNELKLLDKKIANTMFYAPEDILILSAFAKTGELAKINTPLIEYVDISTPLSIFVKLLPSEFTTLRKGLCSVELNHATTPCTLNKFSIRDGLYEVFLDFNNKGALERHQNVMVSIGK